MHASAQELWERVLRALDRGDRPTDMAKRFDVSRVWGYRVRHRLNAEGKRGRLPMGGSRHSRIAHREPTLRSWIQAEGDVTLSERCARLAEPGSTIKVPALWQQLDQWHLSLQNNAARQRARARRRPARTT